MEIAMNDEEIKKALECCVIGDCSRCPLDRVHNCRTQLREGMNNILSKQQLELVFLKNTNNDLNNKLTEKQSENEKLQSLCTSKDVIIKEQQAKIEKLKWEKDHFEFKVDDLNGKLEKFKEYRDIKNEAYERKIEKLNAVIDDLKHEIRNLECEKGQLEGTIDFLVAEAKSEAIKEFTEKVKNYVKTHCNPYGKPIFDYDTSLKILKYLDNLLAEMAGEQNV